MAYREINYCSCGNICEGTTRFCASCNFSKRKSDRQANKVKVVTPIKKVTAKRAAQNTEYLKLRKQYLEAYPCCEVEECHELAVDIHHMGTRANEELLNTDLFMSVCRKHHEQITQDSAWAKANGYSVSRTATNKNL